jgi:hypothetical protein
LTRPSPPAFGSAAFLANRDLPQRRQKSDRLRFDMSGDRTVPLHSRYPQTPLTLTRQRLYELVWLKSMSELAKDFNISDVALVKRYRAVG